MVSLTETDYVTVTQAARELRVGRNEMHRIPVARKEVCGEWFYLWGDVRKWAEQDITLSNSLLLRLRDMLTASALRKKKRENRYTKTGTLKKRFRPDPLVNCPDCGASLKEEHVFESWVYDLSDHLNEQDSLAQLSQKRGGKRQVAVTVKGRRGKRSVTLNLDQETEARAAIKFVPTPRYKALICTNEDCDFCVERDLRLGPVRCEVRDEYDEVDDYEYYDYDEPLQPIDDDIRAMTTTVWSEDGGLLGDIENDDGKRSTS